MFLFSRLPKEQAVIVHDEPHIVVSRIIPLIDPEFYIFAIHLPSQLFWAEADRNSYCYRINQIIQKVEDQSNHKRSFVIGDFNMNPFDPGIVSSEGFHAIMDQNVVEQKSRIVAGRESFFFYNPMWKVFANSPKGTYYYNKSTPVNYYWHCFDQVLIRPDLLEYYSDENVQVLTKTEELNLLNQNGIPDKINISDHLPIMLTLNIQ